MLLVLLFSLLPFLSSKEKEEEEENADKKLSSSQHYFIFSLLHVKITSATVSLRV